MLLARIGDGRYALETANIVEIIHRVELTQGIGMPTEVSGRFNYYGQIVPVVDLSRLLTGEASRLALGTRIVLVSLPQSDGNASLMGVLVEYVAETIERRYFDDIETDDKALPNKAPANVALSGAAYLGKTLLYEGDIIQCLHLETLLIEIREKVSALA